MPSEIGLAGTLLHSACLLIGVLIDDLPAQYAFAGDNVLLVLTGIEMANITVGRYTHYTSCLNSRYTVACIRGLCAVITHFSQMNNVLALTKN